MKITQKVKIILFIIVLTAVSTSASSQITLDSIADGSGYTYIASPAGTGPFPSVLYNHGGVDSTVGGDLRATAIALAQAGYFARAEKRTEITPLVSQHITEVEAALDSLRSDLRADTNCVSIIGFSRGGYFTLEVAKQNPGKVNCIITMAPANPANSTDTLVTDVSPFDDPILILVANNDTIIDENVVRAQMVYDSLISGGKTATLIIYPGYDSDGDLIVDSSDDGHELFKKVQSPYWTDVINFLNANNSCIANGLNNLNAGANFPKIYPNPMSQYATIEFENPNNENHTLFLYDNRGQFVRIVTDITTEKVQIERQNLTSGFYFFLIYGINNQIINTGKLTVE